MKLTLFTDYAMRTLLYLGARQDRLCSIGEVARAYRISQNHLMKVVVELVKSGHVESVRGRSGGIRLGMPAEYINVGAVVRHTEDGFDLVDCGSCVVAPACGLTSVLKEALDAFMAVLDRYTLADMLAKRSDIAFIFDSQIAEASPPPPIGRRRPVPQLETEG